MSQNISVLLILGIFGTYTGSFGIHQGFSIYQWYNMLNDPQKTIGEYNYRELENFNDKVNKDYKNKIQGYKKEIKKGKFVKLNFKQINTETIKKENLQKFLENLEDFQKEILNSKNFFEKNLFNNILYIFDKEYILNKNGLQVSIWIKIIKEKYYGLIVQQPQIGQDKDRQDFLDAVEKQKKILQEELDKDDIQDNYTTYGYILGRYLHGQKPSASVMYKEQIQKIKDFLSFKKYILELPINEKTFFSYFNSYLERSDQSALTIQNIKKDFNNKYQECNNFWKDIDQKITYAKNLDQRNWTNPERPTKSIKLQFTERITPPQRQQNITTLKNNKQIWKTAKFCIQFLQFLLKIHFKQKDQIQLSLNQIQQKNFQQQEFLRQLQDSIKIYQLIDQFVQLINKTDIDIRISQDQINQLFDTRDSFAGVINHLKEHCLRWKNNNNDNFVVPDNFGYNQFLTDNPDVDLYEQWMGLKKDITVNPQNIPHILQNNDIHKFIKSIDDEFCYKDILQDDPKIQCIYKLRIQNVDNQILDTIKEKMILFLEETQPEFQELDTEFIDSKKIEFFEKVLGKLKISDFIKDFLQQFLFNKIQKDHNFIKTIVETVILKLNKKDVNWDENFDNELEKFISKELADAIKGHSLEFILQQKDSKKILKALICVNSSGLIDIDYDQDYQNLQKIIKEEKITIIDDPQKLVQELLDQMLDEIKVQMKKRMQSYTSLKVQKITPEYQNEIFDNLIEKQKDQILTDKLNANKNTIRSYGYNYNIVISVQKSYIENTKNIILDVLEFQKIVFSFQQQINFQVYKGEQLTKNLDKKKIISFDSVVKAIEGIREFNESKKITIIQELKEYQYQGQNKIDMVVLYIRLAKIFTKQSVKNISLILDILLQKGEIFNKEQISTVADQQMQISDSIKRIQEKQDKFYTCYINFVYSILTNEERFTTDYFFRDLEDIIQKPDFQATQIFNFEYKELYKETRFFQEQDLNIIQDLRDSDLIKRDINFIKNRFKRQNFDKLITNFKNVLLFNANKKIKNTDYKKQSNTRIDLTPQSYSQLNCSSVQFYALLANLHYLNKKQQLFKFYIAENNSLQNEYQLCLATKNFTKIKDSGETKYSTCDNDDLNGKYQEYLNNDIQYPIDLQIEQSELVKNFKSRCTDLFQDNIDFIGTTIQKFQTSKAHEESKEDENRKKESGRQINEKELTDDERTRFQNRVLGVIQDSDQFELQSAGGEAGNCFYESIVKLLNKYQDRSVNQQYIRDKVAQHLKNNQEFYNIETRFQSRCLSGESYVQCVDRLLANLKWAESEEIMACASFFRINIITLVTLGAQDPLVINNKNIDGTTVKNRNQDNSRYIYLDPYQTQEPDISNTFVLLNPGNHFQPYFKTN